MGEGDGVSVDGSGLAGQPAAGSGSDPARLARLSVAVDGLVAHPLEGLDELGLRAELAAIETEVRRLSARQTRVVAAMARRRAADAARRKGTDLGRERERAGRQVQQELTEQQQWTPSRAKAAGKLGRKLGDRPQLGEAFDRGQLPPRNAQLLSELLDKLGPDQQRIATDRLLPLAEQQDAVTFGRSCRRLLAELDHDAAMRDEDRRYAARRASVAQRPDGMTVLYGEFSGVDAELVHTAIDAFRLPDAPGQRRTPEQRTADAVVDALRSALRHADAPAQHGVRPHLLITIPAEAVQDGDGPAQGKWTGPLPYGEVRRLLGDAGLARLLIDAQRIPLEASAEVRTVPVGLYRALLVRDGGCIAQGCDAPAAWCDVMHLDQPYHDRGRLSPDNAALGCRHHHRAFDRNHLQLLRNHGRPVLRPPP